MEKFCCQNMIELEPKTLNEGQLHHVRELAVDIIQKNQPPQDSSTLHIQEIKAEVVAMKEVVTVVGETEMLAEDESDWEKKEETTVLKRLCKCNSILLESPQQIKLKEPFSAPF